MSHIETLDPVSFKEGQRTDWQTAAPGWRKWYDVLEGEVGGQVVSRKLVDLAGIGPGDTVLDVATGYGEPALTAARAVATAGRVVATDIAADFLAFGRERAAQAGLDNVDFLESDAEALSFDEESFDAITSRQGLQFLPDAAGTLKLFHSFLKRDGRLAAAVWGPPDTVQFALPLRVIFKELELPPPPRGRPGIFALADAGALERLVADAGFRDVETGTVTAVYETASPEDFTQWTRDVAPPIVNLLKGHTPEVQERVWQKVTEAWAPLVTAEGRVRTENNAIWVAATK
jgi:ubiquinone/menaquinone biosynthesis C-methylase UbiE